MNSEKNFEIIEIIDRKMNEVIDELTLKDIIIYIFKDDEKINLITLLCNFEDAKIKTLTLYDINKINSIIQEHYINESLEKLKIKAKKKLIVEEFKKFKLR